jgi:hypothetical protein
MLDRVGWIAGVCALVMASAACKGSSSTGAAEPTKPAQSPSIASATSVASATPVASSASSASSAASAASHAPAPPRPIEYDRAIAAADLDGRSLRELSLMRNTIYAHVGNRFRKPWLDAYFSAQPWYHAEDTLDLNKISPLARANAAAIAAYDIGLKRPELLARRDAVIARLTSGKASADDKLEIRLLSERLGEWSGGDDVPLAQRTQLEDPSRLDKLVTIDETNTMSRRDLRLLRNLIYARRGRPFASPSMQAYFTNMAWYAPNPSYADSRLTDVDNKNIAIVLSVENMLGGPLSEQEEESGRPLPNTPDGFFALG